MGPRPVRNWAAQQEVSDRGASKALSAAPHHSPSLALLPEPSPYPHPCPWKNCLPQNQSLVPKRLGTTALKVSVFISQPKIIHTKEVMTALFQRVIPKALVGDNNA